MSVVHNHKRMPPGFQDAAAQMYPGVGKSGIIPVTLQVTEDCNLRCTYCYQTGKSGRRMSFETAKAVIDAVLTDTRYISAAAVELDFIGGEPLLEIGLIRRAYEYFLRRCMELGHPWLVRHRVSLCTNGTLYFSPEVQSFLRDYCQSISFSVSLDGTKALHDACRRFPDGSGSYEHAVRAVRHYRGHYGEPGTKMTIAPDNVQYLCDAVLNMRALGFSAVAANCVYEKGWTIAHARELYRQLKRLAGLACENDWYDGFCTSLFEEQAFRPLQLPEEDKNWCGGTGKMLAADWRGLFYPCLRYMPSSLGGERESVVIGDVRCGLCGTEKTRRVQEALDAVTLTSQSERQCVTCPVAAGCAWCSAYNYQETGSFNRRVTYICEMHRARALANVYYWNRFYQKRGLDLCFENRMPKEWAVPIIGEEEWRELKKLEERSRRHGVYELR